MITNYRNSLIIVSLLFSILFSCKKLELDKISTSGTWNPNIAVPLAYGEFGVYDILARTDSTDIVVIDETSGAIALVYKGDLFAIEAKDIVELQDYSGNYTASAAEIGAVPTPSFSSSFSQTVSDEFILDVDPNTEIHEITYNQGEMTISVSNSFNHDVNVSIVFPYLLKNNVPVSIDMSLFPNSSDNVTLELEDAVADLSQGGSTFNALAFDANVELIGSGNPIAGNEQIDVNVALSNVDYFSVTGFYGEVSLEIKDSILLRVFEEVRDGFFQFTDPKVYLEVQNSFGIPLNVDLVDLRTIVTQTGAELPLTGYPTPINVSSPSVMGESASSLIQLDKSNTNNIESIVTPTPKYFYYDAIMNLNPGGSNGNLNFIRNDSELRLKGEVELPLEGYAYGFTLRDTFDFDVSNDDLDNAEAIEYVMFRLGIDNGFPVNIDGQVVFMDENYNVLFTAFDAQEDLTLSAMTDANGRVTQSTKKVTDILLNKEQIELLKDVVYFELIGNGETKNGTQEEVVQFFDDYKMNIRLGVQIEAKQSF